MVERGNQNIKSHRTGTSMKFGGKKNLAEAGNKVWRNNSPWGCGGRPADK